MVKIEYKNGSPFISINGELIIPAAFRSFRPKPDNVSLISRAGVRLCQMLVSGLPCTNGAPYSLYGEVWKGDGIYDFTAFDRQFAMFRKFAPDAYFNIMLQLDTRPWWKQAHPDEPDDSYNHISEFALCEAWKRSASDYLKAFISYAEEKYGDRIYAYSIAAGCSNEWFDNSIYRKYKGKYLTAAYRELVGNDSAELPTLDEMEAGSSDLRSPDSDEFRFLHLASEGISKLICYFAKEAQSVINHSKLFGLFYGYSDMRNQVYWNTDTYEIVWKCPDIDMLYSPAAYGYNRQLDGVSSYQYAVDSIRASNKLYLHENDHRTELAAFPLENGTVLTDCYKSFDEWREVFRRELCNVMQKQSSFWWFDFFGGYYNSPEYEQELTSEVEIFRKFAEIKDERRSDAEIAVFVDPVSFLCTHEGSCLCTDLVRKNIDAMLRCGAPFEYCNLSDLTKLDTDKYKLFIFLNTYIIPDEIRAFIDTKLGGKYKVFLHGSGMSCHRSFDIANTSALCGMDISERGSDISDCTYNGEHFGFSKSVHPLYKVADRNCVPLAYYSDGEICTAVQGKVIYSAVGCMPWKLWRDIAKLAGVHIYDYNGGGLAVCSQFVCSYTTLTDECELHLKADGVYREVFSGKRYRCGGGLLRYHAENGQTMLFIKADENSAYTDCDKINIK